MKRRRFLRWLVAVPVVAIPLARWVVPLLMKRRGAAWERDIRKLESEYANDLKAMTRALLPSEFGNAEADAVATRFVGWLALQRTDAEVSHLSGRLRMEDPSAVRPGTRRATVTGANYIRQIEQLRSQVRPRRLTQLDRIEMNILLTSALGVSGAREIPPGPTGANILLDLLSFFYRSPRAVDLFHGRSIAALSCRGLEGVDRPPAPLLMHPQA